MAVSPSSNVRIPTPPVGRREPTKRRTVVSTEEARQGRGKATAYVLAISILLLLLTYALFGIFSDALLVSDLPAAVDAEVALPGPSPAQEAIIEQR